MLVECSNLDSRISTNGFSMPIFGLGTWQAQGDSCRGAVEFALHNGIKLIDTAVMYQNEKQVGDALRSYKDADKIFVVTKVPKQFHGRDATRECVMRSLEDLPHVDLVLIHSPEGGRIVETYSALLQLRDEGLIKFVGVSNFGVAQLQGLLGAGLECPKVNQIELHVWQQQREVVEFCRSHDIVVMGHCPLARLKMNGKEGVVKTVATEMGRSEPEICLRWSVQKGIVTIPKSASQDRISANMSVMTGGWEISEADMMRLEDADCGFKASLIIDAMQIPWDDIK